ncbi:MAG: hypothetical protein RR506_08715 [Akkermansia sp.]
MTLLPAEEYPAGTLPACEERRILLEGGSSPPSPLQVSPSQSQGSGFFLPPASVGTTSIL